MSKNSLESAYKRLDYEEYTNVIKDTLIPLFDDFDGEFLVMASSKTVFAIKEHWYHNVKMGYNILADGIVIETKSTLKQARKYLMKLFKSFE